MKYFFIGLVSTVLIVLTAYGLWKLETFRTVSSEYDEDIVITRHREGKMVYLIFGSGNGIHVVNYTADSMEYEFLHPPTKQTPQLDGTFRFYNDTAVYYDISEFTKIQHNSRYLPRSAQNPGTGR